MKTFKEAMDAADMRKVDGYKAGAGWMLWRSVTGEKKALSAVLPDGCRLVDGEDSVAVRYDSRKIPELLAADGAVWMRISTSSDLENLIRDFGHAVVVS